MLFAYQLSAIAADTCELLDPEKVFLRGHSANTGVTGVANVPAIIDYISLQQAQDDFESYFLALCTAAEAMLGLAEDADIEAISAGFATRLYQDSLNGSPFIAVIRQLHQKWIALATCETDEDRRDVEQSHDKQIQLLATQGNTVAAQYLWRIGRFSDLVKPDTALSEPQRVYVSLFAAHGSHIFQGLHAHNFFATTIPFAIKQQVLDRLLNAAPVYAPAADYLAALLITELEKNPTNNLWDQLVGIRKDSPHAQRYIARNLGKPEIRTRLQAELEGIILPEDPTDALEVLSQHADSSGFMKELAHAICEGRGKWASATDEARLQFIEALADRDKSVADILAAALNTQIPEQSLGFHAKTPEERRAYLIETLMEKYQSPFAHAIYTQSAIGNLAGSPYQSVTQHFGVMDFLGSLEELVTTEDPLLVSSTMGLEDVSVGSMMHEGQVFHFVPAKHIFQPRLREVLKLGYSAAEPEAQTFLRNKGLKWWLALKEQTEKRRAQLRFDNAATKEGVAVDEEGLKAAVDEISRKYELLTAQQTDFWNFAFDVSRVLWSQNDGKETAYGALSLL